MGDWEKNTNAFGSRMLESMGWKKGEALTEEKVLHPAHCILTDELCSQHVSA